jgi:hypothetical protein
MRPGRRPPATRNPDYSSVPLATLLISIFSNRAGTWLGPSDDQRRIYGQWVFSMRVIRKQTNRCPLIVLTQKSIASFLYLDHHSPLAPARGIERDCGTINHICEHFSLLY